MCDIQLEKPADEMSLSEKWAVFFEYLTDEGKRDKINEIVKTEEGISMASEVLMTISRNEEERDRLLYEESQLMAYYSDLEYAIDEGLEKGLKKGEAIGLEKGEAIGLEKKSIEIARRMKARGRPLEEIVEDTGLDSETVKSL